MGTIKKMLSKNKVNRADLAKMRGVLIRSGALNYAEKEISSLLNKAAATIKSSGIRPQYKNLLSCYSKEILN